MSVRSQYRVQGGAALARDHSLYSACQAIGGAQGITFCPLSATEGDPLGARPIELDDLCASSGLRYREVTLSDHWWLTENGPILGFRKAAAGLEPHPVALLPRGRGYLLCDPQESDTQRVTADVASCLELTGYIFYKPLPQRVLKIADLVQIGLRDSHPDIARLVVVGIASGIIALVTPIITRQIVTGAIPDSNRIDLFSLAIAVAVARLTGALFQFANAWVVLRVRARSAISLQAALWDRLLGLPASFFRQYTIGDLTTRSMAIDRVQDLFAADIASALFSLFTGVFSAGLLFWYSWRLALLAVAATAILATLTCALASHQRRGLLTLQRLNGKLASLIYALLSSVSKLRVAGAEERAFTLWGRAFSKEREQSEEIQRLNNSQSIAIVAYSLVNIIALFVVAYLSIDTIKVADYLAFNAALGQFQSAVIASIKLVPAILRLVPVYEQVKPILKTVPEYEIGWSSVVALRGDVELNRVSFRYGDSPLALNNVSLRAEAGEFIALVGPSGSGKSTCLRLILGFDDPVSGSVTVDGREPKQLGLRSVRRSMGVVLQTGRPLVGDVFQIVAGSMPLTTDEVWQALRFVGLEEDVQAMPMGLFTSVTRRGAMFSGGQCQRLVLARAIARRPRILLLDEATSALDNRAQELVMKNLSSLNITRIVVAHRLSTVRYADRVYVFDRGGVVEQGRYEELVQNSGLFARLVEKQLV